MATTGKVLPAHRPGSVQIAQLTTGRAQSAGISLRQQRKLDALARRRITDAALVVHPDAPERPFRSDESEPDWLRDQLKPPTLACEG